VPPVVKLSGKKLDEMSLIYKTGPDGKAWGPRNPEAMILGTKGGPTDTKSWRTALRSVLKGWGVVLDDVPDNIDGDGDGAQDYQLIYELLSATYYDLQSAVWMTNDEARSVAVVKLIDSFKAAFEDICSGGMGRKAGARHSAADMKQLDSIKDHANKILDAHAQLTNTANAPANGDSKADKESQQGAKDGEGDDDAKGGPAKTLVTTKAADAYDPAKYDVDEDGQLVLKADKEPYGDVEYADPGYQDDKKQRYPIDTADHVRSAWSYINKDSNASKYSSDDLAKVKAKIKAAAKKFDVEISDDANKGGALPDFAAIMQKALAPIVTRLDAIEKAAPASPAPAPEPAPAKKAGQDALDEANAAIAAVIGARANSSPGALPTVARPGGDPNPVFSTRGGVAPLPTLDPHTPPDKAFQALVDAQRSATTSHA
jgi:hypothetical protein